MDALIFTLAVILSVIGLSSIMNYAVRKIITAPLSRRSAIVFFVSPGDYEVVIRSVVVDEKRQIAVIYATDLNSEDEVFCRKMCEEKGVIYTDKSTFDIEKLMKG